MGVVRSVVSTVVVVWGIGLSARMQGGGQAPATWDPAAAAAYLDARMDLLWQRAKTLRTGASEVKCLSCHTALPYMMARPLLRGAVGVTAPTAHESRIVEVARERVAYRAGDQPYYDHTPDKTVESAGVEAVLNAFVLTTDDMSRRSGPTEATVAAMTRLWATQRADGAWDWLDFGLEPYEAPDAAYYGASIAAMAAGSSPGRLAGRTEAARAGLDRLRAYLRTNHASQHLFNRAWALLASTRLDGVFSSDDQRATVEALAARQRPDGGWSLRDLGAWRWATADGQQAHPPGQPDPALLSQSDGFATGLVVYALRQAGVQTDDPVVRRGQTWLRTHQRAADSSEAWAPWRAHSLNHDREHGGARGEPWRRMFMSDLATAFAALALL